MNIVQTAGRAKRFLGRLPALIGAPRPQRTPDALRTFFPEIPPETLTALRLDLVKNDALYAELDHAMIAMRQRRMYWLEYFTFLYVTVRVVKPRVIVETGVFDGSTSCIFLQALADNAARDGVEGRLESVDLPAVESIAWATDAMPESSLPKGHQPGWLIPDRLRSRHTLHLGDARVVLPQVLAGLAKSGPIDWFHHDSLHTAEHMAFEFAAAWPHVKKNGGVISSDDALYNRSWHRFARAHDKPYVLVDGIAAMRV